MELAPALETALRDNPQVPEPKGAGIGLVIGEEEARSLRVRVQIPSEPAVEVRRNHEAGHITPPLGDSQRRSGRS